MLKTKTAALQEVSVANGYADTIETRAETNSAII